MKKNGTLLVLLFLSKIVFAQDITGLWQSEDGSRLYEITKVANVYTAKIIESKRPADKVGTLVLNNIVYKNTKQHFEGAIISADDGTAAFTKIKAGNDELKFKIRRMFFDFVCIKWRRVR